MRIIIAYASVGSGHFKAAEAIYDYLKQKDQNLELKLVDVLENSDLLFRNIYTYGYTFLVSYARPLWSLGFFITYTRSLRPIIKCIHFIINRLNTRNFARLLIQENPDFIISTHFLPSQISSYIKKNQRINSKLITVITDFGVHPFWISNGTDTYIVASSLTKTELVIEGIKKENIIESGIPVNLKFLRKYERGVLCERFGIDKNKFTILIVTGTFGRGPIEEIVDLLYREVQILAVCANNRRLYKRLSYKNYPNVKVFGFVNNIQELMASSDIIITKPGGLTISEVLIMELVPIFIHPIPGQETGNVKALEKYGVGLILERIQDLKDIILNYKDHPERLNKIKENIRKIKKPNALQELYNVICQNSSRSTG